MASVTGTEGDPLGVGVCVQTLEERERSSAVATRRLRGWRGLLWTSEE
jgi:hypothetical protein